MLLTFSNIHKYQQLSNCKTQTVYKVFFVFFGWQMLNPPPPAVVEPLRRNQQFQPETKSTCRWFMCEPAALPVKDLHSSSYSNLWRHCVWWLFLPDRRETSVEGHLLTPPHAARHLWLKNSFRILPPLFLQHNHHNQKSNTDIMLI